MSSDGMLEYEESNYDDLLEKFRDKYWRLWEDFVYDQYREHTADLCDMRNDELKDREAE